MPSPRDRRQELLAAFHAITAAERDAEVDALERLIAPDFRGADPAGQPQDRETLLAGYRGGAVRVESLDASEIDARPLGDVGLVSGRLRIAGRAAGARFELRLRFLDVFAWRDGRWLLVASHATPIPLPPPLG